MLNFYDNINIPSKITTEIYQQAHTICHRDSNVHIIAHYLRNQFNTAIDDGTRNNFYENSSIPIFFCIDKNYSVNDDEIFDTPALNTRYRRPVIMTIQVKDKQQQMLNTLLDYNLRTRTNLKGNTSGNTKIQSLQDENI